MTGLETAALVAAAVWIALLSLVVVLLVRQVGLLTVRLDRQREEGAPVMEGVPLGEDLPDEVSRALPELNGQPAYVLLLGGQCPPCQQLVLDLKEETARERMIAVISGDTAGADALATELVDRAEVVREPEASAIARGLGVATTPFAFEISSGEVTGKAVVRGAEHLASFMRSESIPGVIRIDNGKTEVMSHG